MGRNHTVPPCIVGRRTGHAFGPAVAERPRALQTTTDNADRRQCAKQYRPIKWARKMQTTDQWETQDVRMVKGCHRHPPYSIQLQLLTQHSEKKQTQHTFSSNWHFQIHSLFTPLAQAF